MCEEKGKQYLPIESLDKQSLSDLNNLEKLLTYETYIKGNIISIVDIETLENLELLKINITKNNYPNIFKWKKEIERMRLNWKISKKPRNVKGKTFKQYIQIQMKKLFAKDWPVEEKFLQFEENEVQFDKKYMRIEEKVMHVGGLPKYILTPKRQRKKIANIHFFTKKDDESEKYVLKILIKFIPWINMTYKDLAPKILIICHNHLKNKTNIEEYNDEKEGNQGDIKCINIVVTSIIDSEDYNIENLSIDLKRIIYGIKSIDILSIEKKEGN